MTSLQAIAIYRRAIIDRAPVPEWAILALADLAHKRGAPSDARPYKSANMDMRLVWVIPEAMAIVLGLDGATTLEAAPEPIKRVPSAWGQRAEKVLEREGIEGVEKLREWLESEHRALSLYPPLPLPDSDHPWVRYVRKHAPPRPGLRAAMAAMDDALLDVDRVLEREESRRARTQQAQRAARDYAVRSQQEPAERLPNNWPDLCRSVPLGAILAALGASQGRQGWSCPVCGAGNRTRGDGRAALWVNRGETACRCYACDWTEGSATNGVNLVMAARGWAVKEAARWILALAGRA